MHKGKSIAQALELGLRQAAQPGARVEAAGRLGDERGERAAGPGVERAGRGRGRRAGEEGRGIGRERGARSFEDFRRNGFGDRDRRSHLADDSAEGADGERLHRGRQAERDGHGGPGAAEEGAVLGLGDEREEKEREFFIFRVF